MNFITRMSKPVLASISGPVLPFWVQFNPKPILLLLFNTAALIFQTKGHAQHHFQWESSSVFVYMSNQRNGSELFSITAKTK